MPKQDLIHLSSKAFKKMKRLRLLISHNARFSEEPTFLSNELRLLNWPEYPGESFPSNFCGKNLVELSMPRSHLKTLEGVEVKLLFLMFLPSSYVVNFFRTNLFLFFLSEFPKHDIYGFQ